MGNGKYKELTKNTFLFTISNLGSKIISFLLVPLYTYVLSTSEYGTIDILNTTVSLLIPVMTVNIQDAVLRFSLDKDYRSDEVISAALRMIFISSMVLSIVAIIVKCMGFIKAGWEHVVFVLISFLLSALYNSFSMYLRAVDRVGTIVVSGFIITLLTCSLNIVFLIVMRLGINGYLLAHVISSFAGVIICLLHGKIFLDIGVNCGNDILMIMLVYSAPLIMNSLAWWLNSASDRYILTFFCGAAINGVYAIAYKIPTILSTIQNIFYNAWSISAIKEYDKNDSDGFVGNTYSLYSAVSVIACSIILIANPFIARILYSKDFFYAWRYVPALLVGGVFNGLALFEGCLFTAEKKTKEISRTTLFGAGVNFILNMILIPFYGAYGAAAATCVGYISTWFIRMVSLRKIINMKVSWRIQVISTVLILIQGVLATVGNSMIIQIALMFVLLVCQKNYILKAILFLYGKIIKKP